MNHLIAGLVLTAALVSGPPAARTATGREYGTHVADCAQTMGFSADHNPGMHHGFAQWPGGTCTPMS